jgi:acetyl esterase/lipase
MLHGGGYMSLSRRAIRPHQTQHLLNNNLLPVSLDYRLCPEIDVLSGPITDIRDALVWARTTLPSLAKEKGVSVDVEKVVVVGWSTGGHLAMTTAWTCLEKCVKPPSAILSFYAPTDFDNECKCIKEFPLLLLVLGALMNYI